MLLHTIKTMVYSTSTATSETTRDQLPYDVKHWEEYGSENIPRATVYFSSVQKEISTRKFI
jgi:hypothetical protein